MLGTRVTTFLTSILAASSAFFMLHWHASEKRFLTNGTIANSSYLGKTPSDIPCLRLAEGMTVIFKLELWSKTRVQISPFFSPLSGSQMLIFRLSNHNHYTSFDIRDSGLEECLTLVGRSVESECVNSHTPFCSELFTRRFLLPLLGRTLRWIFTHWHLEEGD